MARLSYHENGDAKSFTGEGVNVFAMATLASALKMFAKYRMRVNSMYTPSAMLAAATRHTGNTYKRGEYMRASEELSAKCQELKARLQAEDAKELAP